MTGVDQSKLNQLINYPTSLIPPPTKLDNSSPPFRPNSAFRVLGIVVVAPHVVVVTVVIVVIVVVFSTINNHRA
jgi:hypothetical protein